MALHSKGPNLCYKVGEISHECHNCNLPICGVPTFEQVKDIRLGPDATVQNWSHISFSYRDNISVRTCYYCNSNMRCDNRKDTHLPKYNVLIIYALKRPACNMQQNPIQKEYMSTVVHSCKLYTSTN
jgi:hypothetical protein